MVAAPPMSFFMLSMPASDLMSSPPVSKQTPLPISVTLGCEGSPQVMSIRRGGRSGRGAADRVDEREVLAQEILADDHLHAGAVLGRQRARGVFELRRAHVVRRRVDQVAREEDALGDPAQVVAVDALGQLELDVLALGLAVAGEAVGAERERERGEPRIVRRVGEAVGRPPAARSPARRAGTGP